MREASVRSWDDIPGPRHQRAPHAEGEHRIADVQGGQGADPDAIGQDARAQVAGEDEPRPEGEKGQ